MKSLNNGFIADVFPTRELKEMQAEIARVLKEREEEEKRDRIRRQYQKELDELLDTIENEGFYVGIPDWPSRRVVVLESEEDDD